MKCESVTDEMQNLEHFRQLQFKRKANFQGFRISSAISHLSCQSTLKEEEVAQIIREVYLNATIKNKKVTVVFREPFATIEKLVKLAKQGIAEIGLTEFKQNIISSCSDYIQSTKKAPEGADLNSSICFKWWSLTYGLKLEVAKIA